MTEAIVWTNPERAEFVGAVARAAGLKIVGAGGPGRNGSASAQRLETTTVEDLRAALADDTAKVILIADAGPFGTVDAPGDAEAVLASAARNAIILTLEPVPASVFALAGGGWTKTRHGRRAIDALRFVPGASDHPMLASLDEVLASFGPVRVAGVRTTAKRGQLGLNAVLLSALSTLDRVLGTVETIDAAITSADASGRVLAAQGRLRDLEGHAAAVLRSDRGTIGRLFASDSADAWQRDIELFGPAGRLDIRENRFTWTSIDGTVIDSGTREVTGEPAVEALAGAIRTHLDQPEPRGEELLTALTLAQAALLSQQTRQPESPAAITRASAF